MEYTRVVKIKRRFSKRELEMLRKPVPKKPCLSCSDSISCCGCQDYYDYVDRIKPYKDSGIQEIAESLDYIRNLGKQLETIKCEYEKRVSELPEELKGVL